MTANAAMTVDAFTTLTNLLAAADEDYLRSRALTLGIGRETLLAALQTPSPSLTCPLCGQPSTHLLACRGCGPEAWGDEFQLLNGETANEELREALGEALRRAECDEEAVAHALPRAYQPGGCLLCPTCWSRTWPRFVARSCPLLLLAERTLDGPGFFPDDYFVAVLHGFNKEAWQAGIRARWSDGEKDEVRRWREAICNQLSATGG